MSAPFNARYVGPDARLDGRRAKIVALVGSKLVRAKFVGDDEWRELPAASFEPIDTAFADRQRVQRKGFGLQFAGHVISYRDALNVFVAWDYGVNPEQGRPTYLPEDELEAI